MERNQFTAGGMLQMDLVMKKFLEYFEEKEKMRYSENCLPWENHSGSCGLDIIGSFSDTRVKRMGFSSGVFLRVIGIFFYQHSCFLESRFRQLKE